MSVWRLMRRSLLHHWRINVAVGLGVAAATAVLLGALLVGDSVRASLRALTLQRLGNIDALLITDRFFRAQLAADLTGEGLFAGLVAGRADDRFPPRHHGEAPARSSSPCIARTGGRLRRELLGSGNLPPAP